MPCCLHHRLICLQLKKFALGIVIVLAFSVDLATTLVVTGVIAAWSLRHAAKRFAGFGKLARKLLYLSSAAYRNGGLHRLAGLVASCAKALDGRTISNKIELNLSTVLLGNHPRDTLFCRIVLRKELVPCDLESVPMGQKAGLSPDFRTRSRLIYPVIRT